MGPTDETGGVLVHPADAGEAGDGRRDVVFGAQQGGTRGVLASRTGELVQRRIRRRQDPGHVGAETEHRRAAALVALPAIVGVECGAQPVASVIQSGREQLPVARLALEIGVAVGVDPVHTYAEGVIGAESAADVDRRSELAIRLVDQRGPGQRVVAIFHQAAAGHAADPGAEPSGRAWNGPLFQARRRYSVLVLKHQGEFAMSRLTITLSEARYKALKEAAVQRDKTIGQLIDESLDFYGIRSREDARDLVRRACIRSKLTESQAIAMAQEHVQAVRRKV